MKTVCAYCKKELNRRPCRIRERNYCNMSHQLKYEYKNGVRDPIKTTEKAHESIRKYGHQYRDNTYLTERNPSTQPEVRKKISEAKLAVNWMRGRLGSLHYNWKGGKPHCRTCGKLLSDYVSTYCKSCCRLGEKASSWLGGISFEPYAISFNNQLKARIRVRDNFICQKCGVPELECDRRLDIHHIDYNKKNCEESNLISLCRNCHMRTNANREHWTNYFQQKMKALVAEME